MNDSTTGMDRDVASMDTPDSSTFTLDVSEDLFRLTTNCVRLHSDETFDHQTLSSLVDHRTHHVDRAVEYDSGEIKEHLNCVPTGGSIQLRLDISKTSAKNLDDLKKFFSQKLGSDLTLGDALFILLLDYMVETKAAKVLDLFPFDEAERPTSTGKCRSRSR